MKILDFVFELPFMDRFSGGVMATIELAKALKDRGHSVAVWFQRPPSLHKQGDFPRCRFAVTYSDNPALGQLRATGRAEQILVYMLSYGMAPDRERINARDADKVWFSTRRTKTLAEADGFHGTLIGSGHRWNDYYPEGIISRDPKTVAYMHHFANDKQSTQAAYACNNLFLSGKIDRVLVFGSNLSFMRRSLPILLPAYEFYVDADQETLRTLFSRASAYLMPSITEGLNLTPAEATLCGCPSVLCDGAIGELYDDGRTCLIAKKNDLEHLVRQTEILLAEPDCGEHYRSNLLNILPEFTWEKTCEKIEEALCL